MESGSSAPLDNDLSVVPQTLEGLGTSQTSELDDHAFEHKISETYELMNASPSRYLCAIPVIEPPPPQNQTETELAKAEEARELIRATAAGWRLISDLDGMCLNFSSGWWSYQFCFGVEVVQYHAVASPKDGFSVRDPSLQQYVLGRDVESTEHVDRPNTPSHYGHANSEVGELAEVPSNTELIHKGNQRYLVQRLEDGTICDLTGRPRTIEIQYHCAITGSADRIGWIKEVTTCAYLMAVYTPRLCKDVAFLPPKPTKAHAITCREILTREQESALLERKTLEMQGKGGDSVFQRQQRDSRPPTIGSIVVGGRTILRAGDHDGQQAHLAPPRGFTRGTYKNPPPVILASGKSKEMGGTEEILSNDAIIRLNLDPKMVENVIKKLREYAGDNSWRLEIIERGGITELLATVMKDEDEEQLGVMLDDEEAGREAVGEVSQENQNMNDRTHSRPNRDRSHEKGNEKKEKQEYKGSSDGRNDLDEQEGSHEEFLHRVRDEL